MIQVTFKMKSDIKTVNCDFFSEDFNFINHLKRKVIEQVKGNIQKNLVLSLVNEGTFEVLSDKTVVYSKQDTVVDNNTEADINTNVMITNSVNTESSKNDMFRSSNLIDYTETNLEVLDMEQLCEMLDYLEAKTGVVLNYLSKLITTEEEILNNRFQVIR